MVQRIEAPIIIIGNGGSGSSLLNQMLNAHPAICMQGEMNFLIPKAWAAFSGADANTTLRNLKYHFDADPNLESRITKSLPDYQEFLRRLEIEEFERRAEVMRNAIARWFCLDESAALFWGFKDIWNGGAHHWDCYDHVFPQATWIHIIRHPLHQLRAAARLTGALFRDIAAEALNNWVRVTKAGRERADTGRYYEIRYEDICAAPERFLSPILIGLGLKWDDECRIPLARQIGGRSKPQPPPADTHSWISATAGLEDMMHGFGYRQEDFDLETPSVRSPVRLEPLAKGRWKLSSPIQREAGHCWDFDLSETAIAAELAAIADDVGHWRRSPLRLFENDRALQPAHALHIRIRTEGGGYYSHWQNQLLFSTSDNSSPNQNDRIYSFDLQGSEN